MITQTDTQTSGSPSPARHTWLRAAAALFFLVVLVAGAAILIGLATRTDRPSPIDVAREQNRLRMLETWGRLWPPASVLLLSLLLLFLISLAGVCIIFLYEKATSSYADRRGLFPIKVRRAWTWIRAGRWLWLPTQAVIYHDPNRAPTATTIYAPTAAGEAIAVQQVAAEDVPPEQLRVTHGAQLAQVAAAAASGPSHSPAQRRVRRVLDRQLAAEVNGSPEGRPPLLSTSIPPARVLPIEQSHIARLLREQGELVPGLTDVDRT